MAMLPPRIVDANEPAPDGERSGSGMLRDYMRGYMRGMSDPDDEEDFAPSLVRKASYLEAEAPPSPGATAKDLLAKKDAFEVKLAEVKLAPAREGRRCRRTRRATVDVAPSAAPQRAAAAPYKVLHFLPCYAPGDALRKEDVVLCRSREATEFAMDKLAPGDGAFVLRSDGRMTYGVYEGRAGGDESALRFRVDKEGSVKLVEASKFASRARVPALPAGPGARSNSMALDGHRHEEASDKEGRGDEAEAAIVTRFC